MRSDITMDQDLATQIFGELVRHEVNVDRPSRGLETSFSR